MRAAGLPRDARIRRAADFAALRVPGGRLNSPSFRLRYIRSPMDHARLGLAVSRRVSKRAVERNRIKRAVRESFRRARLAMPAVDILVIARHDAVALSGAELMAELDRLWPRLRLPRQTVAAGVTSGR